MHQQPLSIPSARAQQGCTLLTQNSLPLGPIPIPVKFMQYADVNLLE